MYYRILGSFLNLTNVVFAQANPNNPTTPNPNNPTPGSGSTGVNITVPDPLQCSGSGPAIACVLQRIITAMYYIALPIVTLMVLIGAFQIMTAGGNAEKVTKGRNTIMYAAIGFVVILFASGITGIIRSILTP